MKNLRVPFRVLFYKDGDDWIAHCLEFNLLGDGANKEEALQQLSEAIVLQVEASVELGNPANLFKPADPRLFMMFAAASDVVGDELHIQIGSISIDQTQAREYIESDVDATLALSSLK